MSIKNYLQKRFINLLVHQLFNTIDEDDILQIIGDKVGLMGGRELDAEKISRIKEDAQRFQNSLIWKILKNEVKFVANKRMYEKGITTDDILAGKLMLHILEIFERKLRQIKNLK